ncbi:bifunctional adenosylcobinamide kinase/adenosylcobinamide-phosphate guanylyltransferase [Cyanobium sp. CH-040]|uniref:bifunctional adenosylcobinamide kinase/adenosylcobinamide-phosphate guanylyltransferase n=1 Tax=Cyanobium sp. CH-040 TaxID=2823708 RepID=UPI0020CE98F8|nr:bifunctional adenosylcobinamide kinase/adenosylcobinamide-phosphate guanylyltransferase [Cyanobium sp. CH-040]MCP9926956.1 bifunctional adenosylcobinamide kinase/adenosylcobinamide-phosphate guanylyltransferase [Cyanobium sp. CH-040]
MAEIASLELITGPARSGKSRWAEHRAGGTGLPVHYLATGPLLPEDPDWQERLARHRRRRPAGWRCLEVGADLAPALSAVPAGEVALVDSLGTWVSWGLDEDDRSWEERVNSLVTSLAACRARVLLVSEQTGWGVVPATAIGGCFRDRLGALEQRLSGQCRHLWLVVAGRALDLLPNSAPVPPDPRMS